MPIDSESKRRFVAGVLPKPDGTIDRGDRAHVAGIYRGFWEESTSSDIELVVNVKLDSGTEMCALYDIITAKSDVNAEVVDVMNVDTLVEPSAGVPPVTPTLNQSLAYLYLKDIRDKTTTTASTYTIFNDAGTALWKYAISDDGSTFTRAEAAAP